MLIPNMLYQTSMKCTIPASKHHHSLKASPASLGRSHPPPWNGKKQLHITLTDIVTSSSDLPWRRHVKRSNCSGLQQGLACAQNVWKLQIYPGNIEVISNVTRYNLILAARSYLIRNLAWALAYLSGLEGQFQLWQVQIWQIDWNGKYDHLIGAFLTSRGGHASPQGGSHPLWWPRNTGSPARHTWWASLNFFCLEYQVLTSRLSFACLATWSGPSSSSAWSRRA